MASAVEDVGGDGEEDDMGKSVDVMGKREMDPQRTILPVVSLRSSPMLPSRDLLPSLLFLNLGGGSLLSITQIPPTI